LNLVADAGLVPVVCPAERARLVECGHESAVRTISDRLTPVGS
jgi:hypothetical protein